MLVLSRKKNEIIIVGEDILIVVVEIRGDRVRLGVNAPRYIPVHRREVFEAIRRNETAASMPSVDPGNTAGASVSSAGSGCVVVTVVDIRGDKVRLGIDAPTEIPVHRREVWEAIQRENARAQAARGEAVTPPREVKLEGSILVLSRQRDEQIIIGPPLAAS